MRNSPQAIARSCHIAMNNRIIDIFVFYPIQLDSKAHEKGSTLICEIFDPPRLYQAAGLSALFWDVSGAWEETSIVGM
jgi:hypothetical protein